MKSNGKIEQWGYETYTSDTTHLTYLPVTYTSKDTYSVTIGATGQFQWNYPSTVIKMENQSFEITSKSNMNGAKICWFTQGY